MGRVFKPADLTRGRKRLIDESFRDLSPGVRDAATRLLESWRGEESEEELIRLMGEDKARRLLGKIRET